MLIQFTVSNYLSFDEETTLSMVADASDQQHPDHLSRNAGKKTVVRGAVIYGANAAGKSNLIKALAFAQNRVLRGSHGDQAIPVVPFRLNPANRDRPSGFEFIIHHKGVAYSYGFRADTHCITEEWLTATSGTARSREATLFERTTTSEGKVVITIGAKFYEGDKSKQFLEFVAEGTRKNQLFLTEAFDRNVGAARPVFEWFREVLLLIHAEPKHKDLKVNTLFNAKLTCFVGDFLREAGTGIDEIRAIMSPVNLDVLFADIQEEEREQLSQAIAELTPNRVSWFPAPNGERWLLTRDEDGEVVRLQFRTIHRSDDGQEVGFRLDEESDGTQRLIHLVPLLFAMNYHNKVVIVDELDRHLHPLLCRRFVEAALRCCGDASGSQIIFTTHDTNLLDLELLRRDEIWFVEKEKRGASRIYSLPEFKTRPDLKISKGYLNGRFGAIPFIGDICKLRWTEEGSEFAPATV